MSRDFEIKGLDKLEKQLDQMAKNAEELGKKNTVTFSELFTDSFIKSHSKFSSFDELAVAGNFDVSSTEAFEAISDKDWNDWITQSTDFSNWTEMQQTAGLEFAKGQLGF